MRHTAVYEKRVEPFIFQDEKELMKLSDTGNQIKINRLKIIVGLRST